LRKFQEKAVEVRVTCAEDKCKNLTSVIQQLPGWENSYKMVWKVWFDECQPYEINYDSVLQMIKEKHTKETVIMVKWMMIKKVGY
jgi:hypothetical protein